MTQENNRAYLGLPLSEALLRLAKLGVTPSVVLSNAPRRLAGSGELRVVWQNTDGSELVACAFETRVREDAK